MRSSLFGCAFFILIVIFSASSRPPLLFFLSESASNGKNDATDNFWFRPYD